MSLQGDAIRAAGSDPTIAYFVEFDLETPVYAWSGWSPFTYEGKRYLPAGPVGAITQTRKTRRVEINAYQVGYNLSDEVDNYRAFVQAVLASRKENISGRAFRSYWAVYNDTGIVGGLRPRDRGFGSHIGTNIVPGQATIAANIEPVIGGAVQKSAAFLSDADHQNRYAGDRFLEFTPQQAAGLAISWDPVA